MNQGSALGWVVLLFAAGCTGSGSVAYMSPEQEPNGFCEGDDDCDAADRCWLVRELDSHLVGPGEPAIVDVNRCVPKHGAGDWCEDDSWCVSGSCALADCGGAPCARGICSE